MEENNNLQSKIINATKWSSITEIVAKLVMPLTNMVLARILSPEAFGVVATITMITSFADMLTDAGFQKYLVQHEFKDDVIKYKSANVAFLTNLIISIFLWVIVIIFSESIAILVGSPGLGIVIAVASVQIPLTSFSSIQMALFRRDFDFKTLFLVRMVSIFIPVLITIPLAILGSSYWALIIGTIFVHLSNAIILTFKSKWKPNFFYKLSILKDMLSFSIWSLIEALSIWLTIWIDAFIIASFLSEYYLGLYKTSTTMVNALMSIITASIVPVLFSTLSRLQNNDKHFNNTFFYVQRMVSILVFPLGVGVYLYSDLVVNILLGEQWIEASKIIGVWALTSAIVIVLSHFCSEVYRAKGRPKLSFLAQVLHLVVLVPTCLISSKFGFWVLVYARSWIRLEGILVHFILMKYFIGFPIFKSLNNILPAAISTTLMGVFGFLLQKMDNGLLWSLVSIIFCAIFYLAILCLFPTIRNEVIILGKKIFTVKIKKKNLGN